MRRPTPPSRSVTCPYCGAPAGKRCLTSTGNSSHESHAMRREVVHKRERALLLEKLTRAFDVPPALIEDKEPIHAVSSEQ